MNNEKKEAIWKSVDKYLAVGTARPEMFAASGGGGPEGHCGLKVVSAG